MNRLILAAVAMIGLCAVASSVEPHAKAEPLIKEVQAKLSQSELLVAVLQRRLKATDDERIEAQVRLVLMRDEIARLNDELESARKGK